MPFQIYGKNVDVTPSMKEYAESRAERFSKFGVTILEVRFDVEADKHHNSGDVFEVGVHVKIPKASLNAHEKAATFYAAVDLVCAELDRQFMKRRGKLHSKKRKIFQTRRLMKMFQPWKWRSEDDEE